MDWLSEKLKGFRPQRKNKILITDYKTPSGRVHLGALRGVAIHELIREYLAKKNQKVEFCYGFDDLDPLDSWPVYLPLSFKKYLGKPLINIPAPDGKSRNFARQYAEEFIEVFNSLDINPKIIWMSEIYQAGKMDCAIKTVLENADVIRKIYFEISGGKKPANWYPLQVICPKCGKIGTTKVTNFDGEKVEFSCEKKMVSWAEGCGYQGKISPFKGNGKLPYKVEVAAKWFVFGADIELAGKDHYTKGGTFDIAKQIAKEVFKIEPAFGFGYEWFLVAGKKMSTSKNIGVSAQEISQDLPAEILRFLLASTNPGRQINFSPEGLAIPNLFDQYDSSLKDKQFRLRFSKVAWLAQMPHIDIVEAAEKEKDKKLTEVERQDLKNRLEYVGKWLKKYAPEEFKLTLMEKMPSVRLDKEQKKFLSEIKDVFQTKKQWQGEDLHQELHKIKERLKIDPKKAFRAIYLIFLNRTDGPQAGWFLASLNHQFVLKRLAEASR